MYICICLCVCLYTQMQYLWRPEEGMRAFGAGVTRGCELPFVGPGNSVGNQAGSSVKTKLLTTEPSLLPLR